MSKLSEARRRIAAMSMAEAQAELKADRQQLFHLRLQLARGEVKNNRQFAQIKADIARLLFRMSELNRQDLEGYVEEEGEEIEEAPQATQAARAAAPVPPVPPAPAPRVAAAEPEVPAASASASASEEDEADEEDEAGDEDDEDQEDEEDQES